MTDKEIKTYENELFPQGKVDTLLAYVINSIDRDSNGIVKKSKKIWVGIDNYMIMKVEFYTGSGRLYRSITCSDFHFVEDILFPKSIFIQDLKSKTDAEITIKDIEINPSFDMDIFIPSNQ